MGRGKKNNTKVGGQTPTDSSQPQPSTSTTASDDPKQEVSTKIPEVIPERKEAPVPAQPAIEAQEEESCGLGLGLDKSTRKKRPKKKKGTSEDKKQQSSETVPSELNIEKLSIQNQESQPSISQPAIPTKSQPPTPSMSQPATPSMSQPPTSVTSPVSGSLTEFPKDAWNAGRGRGRGGPGQGYGDSKPGPRFPGQQQYPGQQSPTPFPAWQQQAAQPFPGQQYPGQLHPGQQHPRQQHPGQQQPGQQHPGQQHPGQQHPGQQHPGQQHPGQQHPGQQHPGQQHPGQQHPGQQHPRQQHPGQQQPGQQPPGQQHPGQQHPGQQYSGQQHPGQQRPGQQQPGQQPPGQQHPGQQHPGQQHPRQQQTSVQPRPGTQQSVSSQQSRSSSLASTSSSSSSAVSRYKIPARINGNVTLGRKIRVLTNYLEMKIKDVKVHRYDISVKPDRPKKIAQKAFAVVKERHFPKAMIAFDHRKNCYTLTPLWKTSDERLTYNVEVVDDNKTKMPFEVVLKTTGILDFNRILNHMKTGDTSLNTPSEIIQAIDVILQQGTLENYVKVGRQFFKRPQNPVDLGYGLEMWTGLFQSAIFTWRPFINIDVAHKGFPREQSILSSYLHDFRLNADLSLEQQRGYQVDLFRQYVKGLKVKAHIGGDSNAKVREYIVNEIQAPPNLLTFDMTDANGKTKKMTVANYFMVEKKCRLKYPNLNCLWVGPKNKNIFYPMELLQVSYGQTLNRQLNERQLQTMVREAATPPNERLMKIKEVIRNMNYSSNPIFKHFKLEIASEFFKVDAKILDAPKLDVGYGRGLAPRNGAWQANRFLKPSALDSWGLIAVDVDANLCRCDVLMQNIERVGRQMGMPVTGPKYHNFNVKSMELQKILYAACEKNVNFLFIIVGGRDKNCYHKIKQAAELKVGLLTQCIKEFTAKNKMSDQTVRNILLKVNSKLMGVNQVLDTTSIPRCIRDGGVMMVGADVTHPSPDQTSVPSIAAVTASFDTHCYMYNIELSVQTPKAEIIVDFEDMIFDHLLVYRKHQRCLPRKIYVFRDGVSEGQFGQVIKNELVAIEKAYFRLDQQRKPEILFLLVQKRHHTRFFLGDNERQNVEPGTVVDTEIVHRSELDFYLVSHSAIKGTARPTRYHAVANDGQLSCEEVEQLTFYLCHLYSRCTRSVSYPTPTYYAHLACLRARSLTFGDNFDNTDLEKKPKRLRVLDKMLSFSRMFFV